MQRQYRLGRDASAARFNGATASAKRPASNADEPARNKVSDKSNNTLPRPNESLVGLHGRAHGYAVEANSSEDPHEVDKGGRPHKESMWKNIGYSLGAKSTKDCDAGGADSGQNPKLGTTIRMRLGGTWKNNELPGQGGPA